MPVEDGEGTEENEVLCFAGKTKRREEIRKVEVRNERRKKHAVVGVPANNIDVDFNFSCWRGRQQEHQSLNKICIIE
jgi:hypothetical protein